MEFELKYKESLKFLEEIVSINSHSYNKAGIDLTQDIIAKRFSKLGLKVNFIKDKKFGKHLIAKTSAPSSKRILLVGHADTVHPDNEDYKKFSMDKSFAYGPGVFDMKGGIAMMYLSFLLLGEKLKKIPLSILIVSDEEIACPSSRELHYKLAKESSIALILEFGREKNMLVTSRKGISTFEIKVKGRAAHSGNNYYDGVSAIVEASRLAVQLQKSSSIKNNTTINVGLISGGTAINTIAENAELKGDLRFASKEGYIFGKKEIKKAVSAKLLKNSKIEYKENNYFPAMVRNSKIEKYILQYNECAKEEGFSVFENKEPVGGASSGNLLSDAKLPVIDSLGPRGSGAHSKDEKIDLKSFVQRAKTLTRFLNGL